MMTLALGAPGLVDGVDRPGRWLLQTLLLGLFAGGPLRRRRALHRQALRLAAGQRRHWPCRRDRLQVAETAEVLKFEGLFCAGQGNPALTIPEIAEKMGIKQSYPYCGGSQPRPRDA